MEHRNDNIEIIGASENNLKHIDVTIPKGKLVVFSSARNTRVSGMRISMRPILSSRT